MRSPMHLVWALCSFVVAGFAIWRLLHQLAHLQGARKALARNAIISTFVAAISVSFSGLMYAIWSGSNSEGQLLPVLAVLGLAIFVASVASAVRTTLRWNEPPRDGTGPV
jgi:hypothetical protein